LAVLIWYLARGAGITAFVAFSVTTGAGAFVARRRGNFERRVVVQYIHRAAALCGLALLAVHIVLLLADSYAGVGWKGALLPFASGYRPWQITLGLLAMYLIVTISVTGIMRARFASSERAVRWWRAIHISSYAAWTMSAVHFLSSGTDSGTWWALTALFCGVAIVLSGVIARLVDGPQLVARAEAPARATAPIGAAR
jgi:hypothetical protein